MADSIADRFIITMAEIKALDALTGNDQPLRHQVRALKMQAERVLDDAIRSAWSIADTARRLPRDAKEESDEAVAKAVAAAASKPTGSAA